MTILELWFWGMIPVVLFAFWVSRRKPRKKQEEWKKAVYNPKEFRRTRDR